MTSLETTLAQHDAWESSSGGFLCDCGETVYNHPVHVADAIRETLTNDQTIERAAESITDAHWCESNYTSGCNCADYRIREARAAITAALTNQEQP